MKRVIKAITATLIISVFFSCSLVTKRGEQPVVTEEAPVEVPKMTPLTPPAKSLKKTIIDQDLKKNTEDKELKKRVVVLPFVDKKNSRDLNILKNSRDAFMNTLNDADEMIAVDSSVLKLDLTKYLKNNMYDLKAIAKDANSVGVSCLLEGRIIDMRFQNEDSTKVDNSSSLKNRAIAFEVVVQLRMINIRSEQELFNMVKTITIDDTSATLPENITSENFFNKNPELSELLIKDAFLDFHSKLVESLKLILWEGRIAAFQGEKIYINVGKISGVQIGDILKVVEDGNEIYDTELGYHVGKVQGKVKGTLEIVGFFGQDGAISVVHSGAGFKENDRVEIYQ